MCTVLMAPVLMVAASCWLAIVAGAIVGCHDRDLCTDSWYRSQCSEFCEPGKYDTASSGTLGKRVRMKSSGRRQPVVEERRKT